MKIASIKLNWRALSLELIFISTICSEGFFKNIWYQVEYSLFLSPLAPVVPPPDAYHSCVKAFSLYVPFFEVFSIAITLQVLFHILRLLLVLFHNANAFERYYLFTYTTAYFYIVSFYLRSILWNALNSSYFFEEIYVGLSWTTSLLI